MTEELQHKPSEEKPWLQFFSEEAIRAELPRETIYQHVRNLNQDHPEDTALNYFGKKVSYGELLRQFDRAAAAFAALGVKTGDIVTFCSVTIPEMIYSLYGLNKIGAAPMVLDPRNSASSVEDFVHQAGSRVLVTLDLAYPHLEKMIETLDVDKVVVFSAGTSMPAGMKLAAKLSSKAVRVRYSEKVVSWETFLSYGEGAETETVPYGASDLAAVALTGGTTGAPKGVMISNDGFNAVAMDFRYCGVTYTRKHKFMNIIPAFASYGIVASLHMPLSLGLEMVIIPKFDSDKVGKYIKKYRPEHTLMVPAHYEKLMNSREMKRGFSLDFFATAGSGGDTMNAGLEGKLNGFLKERGAKFPLSQGYGMSEVSSAASCCCNGNFRSLSVGYPLLMNTIGIFKPGTTEELGYNEEGEICITGPAVMLGYLNNPDETEKVLIRHPDGTVWVHSGDLGTIDEDGFVFIKGRMKRMITMFNGHKVFPTYIESVLGKHPDVQSVAVVGVRDRRHAQGQRVHAVVQLKEGERSPSAVKPELDALMQAEIESSVIPETMQFVEEMPHTGMGKIDYLALSNAYDAQETEVAVK